MSCTHVWRSAAVLLACAFSTPSFADAVVNTITPQQTPVQGIVVAQAASDLSASDQRRMDYYASLVLASLNTLDGPAGPTSESITDLRQKVQRLLNASEKSSVDIESCASFFEKYVAVNLNGAIPAPMLGVNGNIEALQLFKSVAKFNAESAPQEIDVAAVNEADLNAINSVALVNPVNVAAPPPMQLSVVVLEAVVVELPAIPEDANQNIRAVLERVQLRGDEWVIEITQGDSLALLAMALYGDTLQFPAIYAANADILRTPNSITIGQVLVLPKN